MTTPDTDARQHPFALLGEWFEAYAKLLVAHDDAQRKLHDALIAGNRSTIASLELQVMDAATEIRVFEESGANIYLMLARFAQKIYPGRLQQILDPSFSRELDILRDAFRELETHVDEIGTALAKLIAERDAA